MSLKNRLATLERDRIASAHVEPALVLLIDVSGPTVEQQAQIDEADVQGIKVICIYTVDASI